MKRGLMKYLWQGPNGAGCEPGAVQRYLTRQFDGVTVGYVTALGQTQIACFDGDGSCRLVVRYRFSNCTGLWHYEVVPGFQYRVPEA